MGGGETVESDPGAVLNEAILSIACIRSVSTIFVYFASVSSSLVDNPIFCSLGSLSMVGI